MSAIIIYGFLNVNGVPRIFDEGVRPPSLREEPAMPGIMIPPIPVFRSIRTAPERRGVIAGFRDGLAAVDWDDGGRSMLEMGFAAEAVGRSFRMRSLDGIGAVVGDSPAGIYGEDEADARLMGIHRRRLEENMRLRREKGIARDC